MSDILDTRREFDRASRATEIARMVADDAIEVATEAKDAFIEASKKAEATGNAYIAALQAASSGRNSKIGV